MVGSPANAGVAVSATAARSDNRFMRWVPPIRIYTLLAVGVDAVIGGALRALVSFALDSIAQTRGDHGDDVKLSALKPERQLPG
jgi:hypothetical protein